MTDDILIEQCKGAEKARVTELQAAEILAVMSNNSQAECLLELRGFFGGILVPQQFSADLEHLKDAPYTPPEQRADFRVTAVLRLNGTEYTIITTHENALESTVYYIWNEGNNACDCNRSNLIREQHGDKTTRELQCGDRIELVTLEVKRA